MRSHKLPLLVLLAACTLAACSGGVPGPGASQEALQRAYQEAVEDASRPEASELSSTLTALASSQPGLVWQDEPGVSPLLVVTWTSWAGYDDKIGQSMTLSREIWVTAAPQVADLCRHRRGPFRRTGAPEALVLRLEQLLGLPPGNGKDRFVELWVDPQDLFRPCRDPEITDRTCALSFPQGAGFVAITDDYRKWFNDLAASSYTGESPYPWTGLGYTYDWGGRRTVVGLSEFVVRAGADAEIQSVVGTVDYCGSRERLGGR